MEMLSSGGMEIIYPRYYVEWRPNSSQIVFADVRSGARDYRGLYVVDSDAGSMRTLHSHGRSSAPGNYLYGIYADISPSGDQIVFTTCSFLPDGNGDAGDTEARFSNGVAYFSDRVRFQDDDHYYEIGVMALDEPGVRRLTTNNHNDFFPMWSPDEQSIVFLSDPDYPLPAKRYVNVHGYEEVRVMPAVIGDAVHGSEWPRGEVIELMRTWLQVNRLHLEEIQHFPRLARYPPRWSPDGERLVVLLIEGLASRDRLFNENLPAGLRDLRWTSGVYMMRPHGAYLVRISGALSGVTWSPDGKRMALVRVEDGAAALVSMMRDGSDAKVITWLTDEEVLGKRVPWDGMPVPPIDPISWSPDGRHILFRCGDQLCVVTVAGERVGAWPLQLTDPRSQFQAAWSPDGSRIAVYGEFVPPLPVSGRRLLQSEYFRQEATGASANRIVLFTMAPDGSDVRPLVGRHGRDGALVVLGAGGAEKPGGGGDSGADVVGADAAEATGDGRACTAGRMVAYPDAHPELVRDCETLLRLGEALAGDAELDWGDGQHLMAWQGVDVDGRPPRVQELHLGGSGLTGTVPPELGDLSGLTHIRLPYNEISGSIPPQLGQLTNLTELNLRKNNLTGEIPVELSRLINLTRLDLSDNELTGSIPVGLARLTKLKELFLFGNDLAGCIPPALHRVPDNDLAGLRLPDCDPE
ncbi:MAG: hypothetical protein OXG43_12010 [Chloroflexi bacterium]|nr:hypothetical protein [Chloroflexota bacterium]